MVDNVNRIKENLIHEVMEKLDSEFVYENLELFLED
jgi:hypothetical protein